MVIVFSSILCYIKLFEITSHSSFDDNKGKING